VGCFYGHFVRTLCRVNPRRTCIASLARHSRLRLALTALVAGCATAPSQKGEFKGGEFRYTAVSEDGGTAVRVEGIIRFQVVNQSELRGTWQLSLVQGSPERTGPQIGSGQLRGSVEGSIEGTQVHVDLNPQYQDNNVFLEGRVMEAGRIDGYWSFSTLVGPVSSGSFVATPRL